MPAAQQLQGQLNEIQQWLKKLRFRGNETTSIFIIFTKQQDIPSKVIMNGQEFPQENASNIWICVWTKDYGERTHLLKENNSGY